MRDSLARTVSQLNRWRRRSRRRKLCLSLLAVVVAASTLFSLLLPAFTLQRPTFCGLEEHRHDENCYMRVLVCPLEESEEHVHTEDCWEQILTCGLEEHEHSPACYSDPDATESEADWTAGFPRFGSETPRERLTAIAASQLGYRESTEHYLAAEDGSLRGYTRYGDWYGDPCGDWNAMFLAFCLSYAGYGAEELLWDEDCAAWALALDGSGLLAPAGEHRPEAGDPVFFDFDGDGLADRAGLVFRADESSGALEIIEGDRGDEAVLLSWQDGDPAILGYALLPDELCVIEEETTAGEPGGEEDYPAQSFRAELEGLTVCVEADAGAFPTGTSMQARIVEAEQVLEAVSGAVDGRVVWVQAVDISFYGPEREELQPRIPIRVVISSEQIAAPESEATEVVHLDADGGARLVEQEDGEGGEVAFEADSFSIYALVGTTLEKTVLASDGQNYRISVSFGEEAGIPEDASLEVCEIDPESDAEAYAAYAAMAAEALGCEPESAFSVRLFDIKIVDGAQEKVEIAAPVDVTITLADREENRDDGLTRVVHFADGAETGEVLGQVELTQEDEQSGLTLRFEAEGFSVYAVIDAPAPFEVQSLEELDGNLGRDFYFSVKDPDEFFRNTLNSNKAFLTSTSVSEASRWRIEHAPGGEGYLIYTEVDGARRYVTHPSGVLAGLGDETQAAVFEISETGGGKYYFKLRDANLWLQYSGSGRGIRFYGSNENAANSQIRISYADALNTQDDPYGLDGRSFGVAWNNDAAVSAAMTAESITVKGQQRLNGQELLMKPDVLDNSGVMFVSENSDIQEWTFESVGGVKYYLTTVVDGQKKYLSMPSGGSVILLDEPDQNSVIRATPGSGSNAGRWRFTVGTRALNFPGKAADGFNSSGSGGERSWMNLVQKSELNDDDFVLYTAKKVSVSDEVNVYNGQQLVIYTRIWNETKKKYEFYAVDHDGTLILCYDTGDNIEWIGSNVNTALWRFTEYRNEDGTPNYYYELQNTQYGEYIAPQVTGGQTLSDHTIGVNLNGRRYGEAFTTIIAWDDTQYSYSGLKTENGRVVPCSLSEAEDFYFAVVNPVNEQDELSEVTTIDGELYGISMKMVDFNNENNKNTRDVVQTGFFGETNLSGLLSTGLEADGYPTATDQTNSEGHSLSELFTDMTPVNHLFLESIYNESGYFEYDSTQNFAHLNGDGTFTVYDQIGAITGVNERKATRLHGQFMPYNDIEAGRFAYDRDGEPITNQTDVLKNELPDTNPRKGEPLYYIGHTSDVDYFFGMEMSAGFTQTADGLDAWGHDIIFEFSGDDDFWFYVDDELILDLGGVHEAETGSINFRTGEVKSTRVNTTLYDMFRGNLEGRGLSADEVAARLDETFVQKTVDGRSVYVFRDYTQHTMKMFYMERGAGASNLHMRFNLAAVKPGTVELSKKLSGTDSESNGLIEFPYQICYKSRNDGEGAYHLLTEKTGDAFNVTYKGTIRGVRYSESVEIGGNEYEHVFFLKPGQTAVIDLPDDTVDYYIVECGVNTGVYDEVMANGTTLTGQGDGDRKDFAIEPASMSERPKVDYENHVAPGAMRSLSITKWLYDVNGTDRLSYADNQTTFSFRLYLGNEFTPAENLPGANLYPYCVRDGSGNYCCWNAGEQRFESLGITDYEALSAYMDTLSPAEREKIVFNSSMNGSISKIPADHSVEVRDLIVGTHYKLEERDYEIPKGYTLRLEDGYQRIDEGHWLNTGTTPIDGTICVDETPELVVSNQKGWGLTVKKLWSDKDFMASHDDIYFAVYLRDPEDGTLSGPLEDSVRRLKTTESEIYYFFDNIQMGTNQFEDFVIREVALTAPPGEELIVDDRDVVTNWATAEPIEEGGTLFNGGVPVGGLYRDDFEYSVSYTVGEPTMQNENVRTDTVTNSRPGLKIYKTDWSWDALAGAVFTLRDEQGRDVAAETFSSDGNGLVTIAYLDPGTYILTEIRTPRGYVALDEPMTIVMAQDGSIEIRGPDDSLYLYEPPDGDEMAVITIRNRTADFLVIKKDELTDEPLAGVHFALYWQVEAQNGELIKDYQPIAGYEDLVTDADGVLGLVDLEHLRPGTYYLCETAALPGYMTLPGDLCFTIGEDGSVRINSGGEQSWLSCTTDAAGNMSCVLSIPNRKTVKLSIRKVDGADTASPLLGAVFDLYRARDGSREEPALLGGLISRADGLLEKDGETVFELPPGEYHLVEIRAPDGYQLKKDAVVILISDDEPPNGVSYTEGSNLPFSDGIDYNQSTRVYTLKISNTTGFELPATGGIGTLPCRLGGGLLILTGLLYRFRRRRRERGRAMT